MVKLIRKGWVFFEKHRVKLKKHNPPLYGIIKRLYLPANPNRCREYDLWWVDWDDGRNGIVEIIGINKKDQVEILDAWW